MTSLRPYCGILTLALSLLAVDTAQAAAAAPANPGTTLDLNLAQDRMIGVNSFQWGAAVQFSVDRTPFAPSLSDLSWTQALDSTYPLLLTQALTHTAAPLGTLALQSPASVNGRPYLTLTSENARLNGLSMANDAVSGSLITNQLTMSYDPAGLGKTGPTLTSSYDSATHTTVGPSSRAPTSFTGSTPASSGGTSLYLRLGNGANAIAGDSQALAYENWVQIDSAQMGVGFQLVSLVSGGGTRIVPGRASISELTITQPFDASVPVVFADLMRGTGIGQATLEYVTHTAAGPVTFMQLVLNDVLFSGLSLSAGGGLPSVAESLNFTSFSQTVWDINADGSRGHASSVGYDIATGMTTPGRLADNVKGFGTGNLAPTALPLAVPEPQTWALMLAGIGLLLALARRHPAA